MARHASRASQSHMWDATGLSAPAVTEALQPEVPAASVMSWTKPCVSVRGAPGCAFHHCRAFHKICCRQPGIPQWGVWWRRSRLLQRRGRTPCWPVPHPQWLPWAQQVSGPHAPRVIWPRSNSWVSPSPVSSAEVCLLVDSHGHAFSLLVVQAKASAFVQCAVGECLVCENLLRPPLQE